MTSEQLQLINERLQEMIDLYTASVTEKCDLMQERDHWRERALKAEKKKLPIHFPWRKGVNDYPAKDQRPIY